MSFRKVWRSAWIVVAIGVAACGDDALGPAEFEDPAALSDAFSSAENAFDSEAYASFGAIAGDVSTTTASAAAPFLQSAIATLPTGQWAFAGRSAQRAERLRQLAPALAAAASRGPVIDDVLYGNVYRWDETTDEYFWDGGEQVVGLNGVRFILYRVDEFDTIEEPLVEVGYLDLVDESVTGSTRLRTIVGGVGETAPIYVNYLATAMSNALTATGFITNAQPGTANKTLTFDASFTFSQTSATLDATWQLNDPDVTLELTESATNSEAGLVLGVDFRVIRPGEVVQVLGNFTFGISITMNIEVRAGGGVVARIQGEFETAQWVDAGGEPLGLDDLDALEGLIILMQNFDGTVGIIITPIQDLTAPAA